MNVVRLEGSPASVTSTQRTKRRQRTRKNDHHEHSIADIGNYASVSFALKTISRLTASRLSVETIDSKQAYGRIPSKNIASPINVPDRLRSHMDGYALAASDLNGASARFPKILSLGGDMELTDSRQTRLSRGQTLGIATGGPLPIGADTVVPIEDAERTGNKVRFFREVMKGEFCFPIGVDVRRGSAVIRARAPLRAQDIGMLALLGIRKIRVFAKPRIAIIATGGELVEAFESDDLLKVRESHSPILENLIREIGGVVVSREIVRDDTGLVADALRLALRNSEIVLTLGGTSLGEGDLVERAVRRVSNRCRIIHGIRMDRGRVTGIAVIGGTPVVMLPGPVQGAMNAFFLLALPFFESRLGGASLGQSVTASLSKRWRARERFVDFTKVLYVRLERNRRGLLARPLVGETESMSVLTESNGFVVVPERVRELQSGDEVSVRLLPGFSYVGGHFPADHSAMLP